MTTEEKIPEIKIKKREEINNEYNRYNISGTNEIKEEEKEEKIKKEEDTIIDNLNKQQELYSQRYGMKRNKSANNLTKPSIHSLNNNKYYIGNSKIVTNLNQRLYYNEISKKDIDYKILKEKAKKIYEKLKIYKDYMNLFLILLI